MLIEELRLRLQQELPGVAAQLKMANKRIRQENLYEYAKAAEDARQASVMVLLFENNQTWYTALMQRPESNYVHSRQVSLPGGGVEAEDKDYQAAALRETEEEFGIPASAIEVIGKLSPLYIPVSNYLVHPFVGYLKEVPTYTPDTSEVDEIFNVSLDDLLNPALRLETTIDASSGLRLKNVPYFALHNKIVWGATAMMLSEFVTVLEELECTTS